MRGVMDVYGLVARGQDADPRRPLQKQRRLLLALEDGDERLHLRLEPICTQFSRPPHSSVRTRVQSAWFALSRAGYISRPGAVLSWSGTETSSSSQLGAGFS